MRAGETANVILLFIDGLGIGERDEKNPLSQIAAVEPLAHFKNSTTPVIYDGVMTPTDPRLGVEGRPQSASGPTTILTGVNAPGLLGCHKQGFPNQALRDVISENSIFLQLKNLGIEPNVFANAYTPQFFQAAPRWKSATTVAVEAAGLAFRRLPDLIGRKAVFHDFTNLSLREKGFDVPVFSPADAAAIINELAADHRFVLYEHFLTDKIGHDRDFEKARRLLPILAEFVREVVRLADLEKTTVLLTSDHGNIEDLSVRNHTLNDVPTVIWGRNRRATAARIKSLADITPAIIGLLSEN